jgi:hypothetical protein
MLYQSRTVSKASYILIFCKHNNKLINKKQFINQKIVFMYQFKNNTPMNHHI